jgi:hypothetical protein
VWSKNAKISTPKLNLKAKNIYVKTLLNLENLKNTFLSVNVKKNCFKKVTQKVAIFGYLIFSKNKSELSKVAQSVKITQEGHPGAVTM